MTPTAPLLEIQDIKSDDLSLAVRLLEQALNHCISDFQLELESQDYRACSFRMANYHVRFRSAKITSIKTGQFVTLWKRENNSSIKPFDLSDAIDYVVVSVRKDERFGLFIFPRNILNVQDILSGNGKNGKRGFRVYPPWDVTESNHARKTQKWQLDYFYESSALPRN